MDQQHIDKKERLAAGSMATKTSALGARKHNCATEDCGIIEEGKIYFFYRQITGLYHQSCNSMKYLTACMSSALITHDSEYLLQLESFATCRPRTGLQEAHDTGDIQRFFIVMLPTSRPAPARLVVVGKKRLPKRGQRFWAAVLKVADTVRTVACSLKVLHTL